MNPARHATIQGKLGRNVLAAGVAALGVLIYATVVLPDQQRNRAEARKIQELTSEISSGRAIVQRVRDLESLTSEARAELHNRLGEFAGRPLEEWLPQLVWDHLKGARPLQIALQPEGVWSEDGLPGYQRNAWKAQVSVDGGGDSMSRLFRAVAELAAELRFIKVVDFAVHPNPQNAAQLDCAMTLVVLDRAGTR